jgi:hypothetical protein
MSSRHGRRWTRAWLALAAAVLLLVATTALGLGFRSMSYTVGSDPFGLVVGDFNRDGVRDLAVANFGGPTVSILRGRADGTFKPPGTYDVNGNPSAIAVGRFNKGRDQDLAVATNNAVSVLLGRRGMNFGQAHFYGSYASNQARGIATADFDDDGLSDLAVSNDHNGGQLSVLFGTGGGTFGAQQDFAIGVGTGEVAVGRLNDDNIPDVVVAGPVSTDEVSVLLGKSGSPFLELPQTYAAGPQPVGIALGDFNRDGDLDLAASDQITNAQNEIVVSVLKGDGAGGFGTPDEFPLSTSSAKRGVSGATDVTAADLNGDGRLDLAAAIQPLDKVSALLGKPGLDFSKPQLFKAGDGPRNVASGRFDPGHAIDLVVDDSFIDKVRVLLNRR